MAHPQDLTITPHGSDIMEKGGLLLGVAFVLMIMNFYRWHRKSGVVGRLLINRSGVEFDHPDIQLRLARWEIVEKARYSWVSGRFFLEGKSERRLLVCPFYVLGSPRGARRCAKAINRLSKAYLS